MGTPRLAAFLSAVALVSAAAACNAIVGNSEGYLRDDDAGAGDASGDGSLDNDGGGASGDGAPTGDGGASVDSGGGDSGGGPHDSGNPWGSAPIDPKLSLPDPNGAPCTRYGDILACPTHDQTCRIASPSDGRCELYSTTGAVGYSCSSSRDCDAFLECYGGVCTPFCDLDGGSNCYGRPCLYVGNTGIGVCEP